MIDIISKDLCTGCRTCSNICPKEAIDFIEDKLGYLYPKIDNKKCINCNICKDHCPIATPVKNNNYDIPVCKLSWNSDAEVRKHSTSGGIFSLLCNYVLNRSGYVIGVEIDSQQKIRHIIINNVDQINRLRGSKYVQSDISYIYNQTKELLLKGSLVLFSGTPCQNAGLKSFLGRDYDNLFMVDIICHGVVSQKIFNEYIKSLEKNYNSKINTFEFRNKDFGWNNYTNKAVFSDNSIYQKDRQNDYYMKGYLKYNLFLRESCTKCSFKCFPRVGDITLGDFWGAEQLLPNLDDRGVSIVLINSNKGKFLYSKIDDLVYDKDVLLDDIIKNNQSLVSSSSLGKYNVLFSKLLFKKDFISIINYIEYRYNSYNSNIKGKIYLKLKRLIEVFFR